MTKSLVKVAITTLALAAVAAVFMIGTYVRTTDWDEQDARREGVLWVLSDLENTPANERQARLATLQPSIQVPVELLGPDELTRRAGEALPPGARAFLRTGRRERWLYAAFADGRGGIAAGPADPIVPTGIFPIGLVIAAVVGPLIGFVVTFRIGTQLRKVERASSFLGAGQLSARVDNPSGPSSELALSFNAMAARIERLVKGQEELLQAVSHELGTPLARLRLQVELLASDANIAPATEAHHRLNAMEQEIDELDKLVAELLDWIQAEAPATGAASFDAVGPLHQLAELAQFDEEASPTIAVDVEAPAAAACNGDPRLYQRAVGNLLRNAVRYARSRVLVGLETDGRCVRVTVDDDGPGIPVDQRAAVLEPFARLQADRGRRSGGAGLGLAIVSRIARSHGGSVVIDDSPLGGARVSLHWPA